MVSVETSDGLMGASVDVLRLRESGGDSSAAQPVLSRLERAHTRQDGMSKESALGRWDDAPAVVQMWHAVGGSWSLVGEMKERIKGLHVKKLVRE